MAVRGKREVETGLKRKGFRQDDGDHHWYFYWTAEGKKTTVRTKTSHGSTKDLGDGLLKEMARQVRVTKLQFLELVDCAMTREEFEGALMDGGHL